jgi:hypothetical protein
MLWMSGHCQLYGSMDLWIYGFMDFRVVALKHFATLTNHYRLCDY